MKKGLVIVLMLLMLPIVNATISIEGPSRDIYNAGDEIYVSGYVANLPEAEGFLKLVVVCNNQIFPLTNPVAVSFGQSQKFFPAGIDVQTIKAISQMAETGSDCFVKAQVIIENKVIEEAKSSKFEVSKGLLGNFEKKPEAKIQLGDSIQITGSISYLDGKKLNGNAVIYFKDQSSKYVVGEIEVKNGIVDFEYASSAISAGKYSVDIFVKDSYGNEQLFENAAEFELVDKLNIFANTDKEKINPGDSFEVTGEARTITQKIVETGNAEIIIGNIKQTATLKDGKFSAAFRTVEDIKSGEHDILVNIKDKFGNSGQTSIIIFVQPVISYITVNLNNEVSPNDNLEIEPIVLDQGNDTMSATVLLEVLDPDEDVVFSKNVQSGEKIILQLSQFALPGVWKVKAKAGDVKSEEEFKVKTVEELSVEVVDNKLVIRNIGNVKHKGEIVVDVDGALTDYQLVKKKSLKVNESLVLDLEQEVPAGDYKVKVPNVQGNLVKNIKVNEGKERLSLDSLYILLGIAGILLMLILMKVKLQLKPKHYLGKGYRRKKEKAEEPEKRVYGKADEADIEDFKKRVLEEVKRIEEKEARYKEESKEDDRGSGGLFSMFNKD